MRYLIALLAVAGVVVSALGLHVHLMDPGAAPPCAVSEHWDCGTVNHSRYSWFPAKTVEEMIDGPQGKLHIPVAVAGIAGYAVIAIFAVLGRMWIVLELAGVGCLCAAYLSYIEAYVLHMWCIYCVWSQGIIAAILLATVAALWIRHRGSGGSTPALLDERVD